jgi:ABC-type phosphate/phosphonate transport system substrate-binding protein
MKKVFLILSLLALGCSLPVQISIGDVTSTPQPTATLTITPQPTGELGAETNPLILALAPSPHPTSEVITAGETIAALLSSRTGYKVVTVIHVSELSLLDAIQKNNAHIFPLSPYGYVVAKNNNFISPLLARVKDGQSFYGAQFIINREKGFTTYFDEITNENTTADVSIVFKQFQEKKACWSDELSASGYVIPLGVVNQAQIQVRSEAFLDNQPSVVRAVYADDICDFGATFIDSRISPILEADYPDVLDKVKVLWRIPNIIPYENISMTNEIPLDMRRVIQRAFIDLMLTEEGKLAIQTVYGFDDMQVVEEAMYVEFIKYANASGLDLTTLIK